MEFDYMFEYGVWFTLISVMMTFIFLVVGTFINIELYVFDYLALLQLGGITFVAMCFIIWRRGAKG